MQQQRNAKRKSDVVHEDPEETESNEETETDEEEEKQEKQEQSQSAKKKQKVTKVTKVILDGEPRLCSREDCPRVARVDVSGTLLCKPHKPRRSGSKSESVSTSTSINTSIISEVLYSAEEARKKQKAAQARERLKAHATSVVEAQVRNKAEGKRGDVRGERLVHYRAKTEQSKQLPLIPGYFVINLTSGSKKYKTMSPMYLGEVPLDELDPISGETLPRPEVLENGHQFAKVFPNEVENGTKLTHAEAIKKPLDEFKVLPVYWETRKAGHLLEKGQRYKQKKGLDSVNPNVALFSIIGGKRYSYVQARVFYCRWWSELAVKTAEYKELVKMLDEGKNLLIVGYDGLDVHSRYLDGAKSIEDGWQAHFEDVSRPMGHESVAIACLTIADPSNYPWEVYARKHSIGL